MIRLMEVLLDGGAVIAGRRATELQHAVVTQFHPPPSSTGSTNSGTISASSRRTASSKATAVAMRTASPTRTSAWQLRFLLFHQRLCGPLANSLFHHRPDSTVQLNSPLEAAYHKADAAIEDIVHLLEAA
jgi:hypothetical protein